MILCCIPLPHWLAKPFHILSLISKHCMGPFGFKVSAKCKQNNAFIRSYIPDLNEFVMTSLNGTQIDQVPSYKYLGVWLDDKLSFKEHITVLVKKLKFKVGFFSRNKACLTLLIGKKIVQALGILSICMQQHLHLNH